VAQKTSAFMVVTNAGNVGVGTTSPGGNLEIYGLASNNTTNPTLKITGNGTGSALRMGLRYGSVDNAWIDGTGALSLNPAGGFVGFGLASPGAILDVANNSTAAAAGIRVNAQLNGSGPGLKIISATRSTSESVMEVDSNSVPGNFTILGSGNVGIGTTSPSDHLHVYRSDSAGMTIESGSAGAPARRSILTLASGDTNRALGVLTKTGGTEGWFFGQGYSTSSYTIGYGSVLPEYPAQTKLSITTTGNVGIGTAAPTRKLQVVASVNADYAMQITNGGGTGYGLYINSGSTGNSAAYPLVVAGYDGTSLFYVRGDGAYYHSGAALSTKESKEEIRVFDEDALGLLKDVQVVSYRYKIDPRDRAMRIGFLANDENHVYDERLTDKKRGFATETIVGVMIKAFQQVSKNFDDALTVLNRQDKQIAELEEALGRQLMWKDAKIQSLEKDNAEMKRRLDLIEKAIQAR
jgi:hypothetical protein